MPRTTASLVCYKNQPAEIDSLLRSIHEDPSISAWVVVNNGDGENPSEAKRLRDLAERNGGLYVNPGSNVGFGSGHNAALAALKAFPSEFHLMLNPDIVFTQDVIPALENVMDSYPRTGLLMPRVLYPDRTTQYLCKLLPTPLDSGLRRFAPGPLRRLAQEQMHRYELRGMDADQPAEIPFLSGCFMFTRRSTLEAVGGFDEGYFLYMEDVDLCRRISSVAELLYWPGVSVTHRHERGSHRSLRLTWTHMRSAIRYFNHWGWFFDKDRRRINRAAFQRLVEKSSSKKS